jgi:C4-type Zn-finger protein
MRTIHLINDTRNTEDIVCEDEYEAEKLMWILSSNRKEQKLKHATTVGEKEMIVVLDDDSSHSVMMSDEESAHKLQKTAHRILFEGRKLLSICTHKNIVYIDIE